MNIHCQKPEDEDRCVVSVIVPLFNAENSITATLDSIVATRTPGLEIVIVDDGSADGSLERVRQFKDAHSDIPFLIECHPEGRNLGPPATRNYAASLARGRYLAFLDADDLYHPHRFTESIRMLDADASLGAVFGTFKYLVNQTGHEDSVRDISKHLDWDDQAFPSEREMPFLTQLLKGNIGLHTSTVTLRREVFYHLGGFPQLRYVDDHALWLRLLATEKVARVPGPHLSLYRIHEHSWCSSGEDSVEFIFGPVLSLINAITWLKSQHPDSSSIREISRSLPGKLYYKYLKVADKDRATRFYMIQLMFRSARACPNILRDRKFWGILIRLLFFRKKSG